MSQISQDIAWEFNKKLCNDYGIVLSSDELEKLTALIDTFSINLDYNIVKLIMKRDIDEQQVVKLSELPEKLELKKLKSLSIF